MISARAGRLLRLGQALQRCPCQHLSSPTRPLASNSSLPALISSPFSRSLSADVSPAPTGRRAKKPLRSLAALGGFTYPGPRKLSDIVKLPLLNAHDAPKVREIWTSYHMHHASSISDAFTAEEFGLLMQRSGRCPNFVIPIARKAGFFTLIAQFQGRNCLVTYLEDYKRDPANAEPYLTFTLFDELVKKKAIALLRGEVTNNLTRDEAKKVLGVVKHFYLGSRRDFDTVVAFNEKASAFDFDAVLKAAGMSA